MVKSGTFSLKLAVSVQAFGGTRAVRMPLPRVASSRRLMIGMTIDVIQTPQAAMKSPPPSLFGSMPRGVNRWKLIAPDMTARAISANGLQSAKARMDADQEKGRSE